MLNNHHPLLGKIISFCPDLDRGAQFLVKEIIHSSALKEKVKVTLYYTGGRWTPPGNKKNFKVTVPQNFTENDLTEAWNFQ